MSNLQNQRNNKLLISGIVGALVAAVCCFTPILVIGLIGVGLSALVGGIDYVVFPIMFASLGLIAYALYQRSGGIGFKPKPVISALVIAFSAVLLLLEFKYALRISFAAVALVAIYGFYLRSAQSRTA
jgi:mercuric ion transport protein